MNSKKLFLAISMALSPVMVFPVSSNAQGIATQRMPHVKYKLFDLGTLGGSNSGPALSFFEGGPTTKSVSNGGDFAGEAELSTPDPFSPNNCFVNDCNVVHATRWKLGKLTDLGALPGPAGLSSAATWISGTGLIAGFSENGVIDPFIGAPAAHGVLWKLGEIIDLGVLKDGYESYANAVNDFGIAVGFASNTIPDANSLLGWGVQTRAVVWRNGMIHDLGTLGGTDALALYINDFGQIVGESYTPNSIANPSPSCGDSPLTQHGFIWENGKMIDLNTLGGNCTFVYALNNQTQVIGQSTLVGDSTSHPFIWENGIMKDLGTLGGNYGYASWLNDAGEVVGSGTNQGEQALLAFIWKNGAMSNLGTLNGNSCSAADAINSKGQVVGGSGLYDAPYFPSCTDAVEHGVLWENGQALDLNLLITSPSNFTLNEATYINDNGEIGGFGTLANGDTHAFVLIPCDATHQDLPGCDYTLVDESTLAPTRVAQPIQLTAGKVVSSPSHVLMPLRSHRARQQARFGSLQPR